MAEQNKGLLRALCAVFCVATSNCLHLGMLSALAAGGIHSVSEEELEYLVTVVAACWILFGEILGFFSWLLLAQEQNTRGHRFECGNLERRSIVAAIPPLQRIRGGSSRGRFRKADQPSSGHVDLQRHGGRISQHKK
jgi:hypothetical protein